MNYPYMSNTGNLRNFLTGIPERRIPDIIDEKYLQQLGLTSRNDKPILKILEFIGFIDNHLKPTKSYSDYRNADKAHDIMAMCIRDAYDELFGLYSDAHLRTKEELMHFFRVNTNLSASSVKYVVNTFLTLCEFGFDMPTGDISITKDSSHSTEQTHFQKPRNMVISPESSSVYSALSIKLRIDIDASIDSSILKEIMKIIKEELLKLEDNKKPNSNFGGDDQ